MLDPQLPLRQQDKALACISSLKLLLSIPRVNEASASDAPVAIGCTAANRQNQPLRPVQRNSKCAGAIRNTHPPTPLFFSFCSFLVFSYTSWFLVSPPPGFHPAVRGQVSRGGGLPWLVGWLGGSGDSRLPAAEPGAGVPSGPRCRRLSRRAEGPARKGGRAGVPTGFRPL